MGVQALALYVLDSATSAFSLCPFADDMCCMALEMALRQLRPREVMFMKVGVAC